MFYPLGEHDKRLAGLFSIRGLGLTSNVYAFGKRETTLVDSGDGAYYNLLEPELRGIGMEIRNVRKVIVTHAHHDHANGLVELVRKGDPKVFIFHTSAKYIVGLGRERIVGLREGDTIETETFLLKVIHTPGHTDDSICLYDEEKRVVFTGDTIFGDGSFGNPQPGEEKRLIASLAKAKDLDVDIMLPGHGRPVLKDASSVMQSAFEAAQSHINSLSLEDE